MSSCLASFVDFLDDDDAADFDVEPLSFDGLLLLDELDETDAADDDDAIFDQFRCLITELKRIKKKSSNLCVPRGE